MIPPLGGCCIAGGEGYQDQGGLESIWYGIWYMVYGIWYMVYGIWYMVYGIWWS